LSVEIIIFENLLRPKLPLEEFSSAVYYLHFLAITIMGKTRLYVGNLPSGVRERDIEGNFNDMLKNFVPPDAILYFVVSLTPDSDAVNLSYFCRYFPQVWKDCQPGSANQQGSSFCLSGLRRFKVSGCVDFPSLDWLISLIYQQKFILLCWLSQKSSCLVMN
jgi:hypothetical protein